MNEAPHWTEQPDRLELTTAAGSDFWRKTHDGAIRDNGHFRHGTVTGDFVAEVKLTGDYNSLYDHAGIMLWVAPETWLKCGVEFVNGVQHASAVVTRDYSDWSVVELPQNPVSLYLRVKRAGATVEVFYSLDGATWTLIRVAHLTANPTLQLGLMAAAPKGAGFRVVFEGYSVQTA